MSPPPRSLASTSDPTTAALGIVEPGVRVSVG
jgi:hypothetical protein